MTDERMCACGHRESEHHTSWFASTGAKLVEECEHEECERLPWDQACTHFRPLQGEQGDTHGND